MKLKKHFILSALLMLVVLIASGCNGCNFDSSESLYTGNMNEMDYFNKYVDELNKTSRKLTILQNDYENNVPLDVTANDEISFIGVYKEDAEKQIGESKSTLLNSGLQINNEKKQKNLEKLFNEYIEKYYNYLNIYEEVGKYYADGTYKQDISKASTYEESIQAAYSELKTEEDKLYSKIEEYQQNSDYKANINSKKPLERINATIDAFTDSAEELYNLYMVEWDVQSEPTQVKNKYEAMITEKEQMISNINELDYSDVNVIPVKKYFDENYLVHYESLLENTKKLIDDYEAGLVSDINIGSYDTPIQNDYQNVITSHNEIINLTRKALNANY